MYNIDGGLTCHFLSIFVLLALCENVLRPNKTAKCLIHPPNIKDTRS